MAEADVEKQRSPCHNACTEESGGWLDLAPGVFVNKGHYRYISKGDEIRNRKSYE